VVEEQIIEDDQEILDELNPGFTSGDLETLEAALAADGSIFYSPEANENSTLSQWEAEVAFFQVQLDNWGALKDSD